MKRIRLLTLLLTLCMLLSSFAACAKQPTPENSDTENTEAGLVLSYTLSVKKSDLHTSEQNAYLNSKNYTTLPSELNGKKELSYPGALILQWKTVAVQGTYKKSKDVVYISEDEAFSDSICLEPTNLSNKFVEFYPDNAKLGTTYYWYVEGKVGDLVFKSDVATVTIDLAGPRNLNIPGVANCRDLGGWSTLDGKTLRQGQLYRTGKLTTITKEGEKVLLEDLGIKTEIDLRTEYHVKSQGDSTEESHLGNKLRYFFLPMDDAATPDLLTASINEESILGVFEVLGDESNYPILFHCNIGTDRTGLIAFLVLGLCGVAKEDIYRDYLFSGFGKIDRVLTSKAVDNYLNIVQSAAGTTLAQKIENYLLSRGVTAAQIATVRKMMR